MKRLSCLIIEDTESDARSLMNMLTQPPLFQRTDWCQTAADALNRLAANTYDLVFLDIRLPDQTGINFLRDTPRRPPIIVMSASLEYALPCYDLQVVDFLSKPFEQSRLQRAIVRALSSNPQESNQSYANSIFLQTNRQLKKFLYGDIQYVEAHGSYTKIHTAQDITIVSHAISWIETQLPATQFLRIQKSFIVNLHHIAAVNSKYVWINTAKLSIGTQYVDLLRQFVGRREGGLNLD